MSERWLIIADDLTGAADSAIAFARRGAATRVLLGEAPFVDDDVDVVSVDVDSRGCARSEAAARHASALRKFAAPSKRVFKKIDSTLRGHLAAEIAALRGVLAEQQRPTFGVFAPAFPAMARTTRDGRVHVHGRPLEQTETWQREHAYPSADLESILASAGLSSVKVPLDIVRSGQPRLRDALRAVERGRSRDGLGTLAICDAERDEDLDDIAAAARASPGHGLLIGTAGLARAIARTTPEKARAPRQVTPSTAGALLVVGSLASVSRQGARAVASMRDVLHLPVDPLALLECGPGLDAACQATADALRAGTDVLLEITMEAAVDLSRGPVLARSLAQTFSRVMSAASGIIVTGGETGKALMASHRVTEIELLDEIEDGVCLGLALRDRPLPLITKSGAFGNPLSLVRALEKLRMIRSSGRVT